jgi:acyl-CoA synthetase (NDP forming)
LDKEGAAIEKLIVDKIRSADARMIGPNCMGVISTLVDVKLNATFVAEKPEVGTMAFLSQSGALGAAVLNSLRETDIRFAHFISVGNKADLNENDFVKYWEKDDNISVTTYYLESFENGFEFVKPFMNNEIEKPAIVLKAGKTKSGMIAASSHTGALSSQNKIVDSLLDQYGVIRADNLNEMFNTAKGFENYPIPKGENVAVVTNAGGPAILTVDKLEEEGLKLAELSVETKSKLREIVHPEGSINNPVDLLPGGSAEIYKSVNEILCNDNNVDSVISIFVEPVMVEAASVTEAVNSIHSEKPIFQVVMPLPEFWSKYRENKISQKPIFRNPEDPSEIISNMLFHNIKRSLIREAHEEYSYLLSCSKNIIEGKEGFLDPQKVNELVSTYSIPVAKEVFIDPIKLSQSIEIDYPIVLKAIGSDLIHKSDIGAVKTDIKDHDELVEQANKMIERLNEIGKNVDLFHLQEYVSAKHELLIGGFRDPSFGPVIMFGSGGKYVEVFEDTQIKSAYSSHSDLIDMINKTKIGKILKGVRGENCVDIDMLLIILHNCCKLLIENTNIVEFDINPLLITNNNEYKAVDVRVKIDK